jgi:ABC-type bacteriocin/lantibiotic exporter with double-glycine peptidase domain
LQTVRVHLARLRDIVDEEPEQTHEDLAPIRFKGRVDLDNVCFRYSTAGPLALDHVSFTLNEGEFVAVVGPSGSGKSTLSRLILGLVDPLTGEIRFDGIPTTGLNLSALRQQCGLVTQMGPMVSGTIATNVKAGREDLTDADVMAALHVAALDKDVARMPLGLSTPLGEGGNGLSGGQMQRLSIARAVAGHPRLIVLDEATSHLDAVTETEVTRRLAELHATRVVIAHRLSTIKDADRIIVLVAGQVEAIGTHHELLQTSQTYRAFVDAQTYSADGQMVYQM